MIRVQKGIPDENGPEKKQDDPLDYFCFTTRGKIDAIVGLSLEGEYYLKLLKELRLHPEGTDIYNLYWKTIQIAEESADSVFKLYKASFENGAKTQKDIFNSLIKKSRNLLLKAYESAKNGLLNKARINELKEEFFEENEKIRITKDLIAALPQAEVAKLNLENLETIEFKVVRVKDFKHKHDYKWLKDEVLASIKAKFPAGDEVDFEENYLNKENAELHIVTCNGKLLVFFGLEDMPLGTKYLDWFIANPKAPIKGLSEAAVVSTFKNNIHSDCYLVAKPHVKSHRIFVERLGFVTFDTTDQNEYKHTYLRCRKLNSEKNLYLGHSLNEEGEKNIRDIFLNAGVSEIKDFITKEGKIVKICKIQFHGQTSFDDIDANAPDGHIFKLIPEMHKNGYVLTRYLADPINSKDFQIFYCIFEPDQLDRVAEEKLMQEVRELHKHKEVQEKTA